MFLGYEKAQKMNTKRHIAPTLIEQIAENRWKIVWDEAANLHPEYKSDPELRAMYQIIPCFCVRNKFGIKHEEIYEYGYGKLAWLCYRPRVAKRLIVLNLDWLEIQVETDEETVFLFSIDHTDEISKWAKPLRPRILGPMARKRLSETGKNTRF
jgi:hypothetical protein